MGALRRLSAVALLRVLLVACIVMPSALLSVDAWFSYGAVRDEVARDMARLRDVAHEHAVKVFTSHELIARRATDLVRGKDDAMIRAQEQDLHEALNDLVVALQQIGSLIVLDSTGHLLVATRAYPVSRTVDFSDRDYFVALKPGAARTYLSRVQDSRIDGRVFFGLGRRLEGADGAFRGVVSIAVSPQFFVTFWARLVGDEGGGADGTVLALVRDDGAILARHPSMPEQPISAGAGFMRAISQGPESGTFMEGPLNEPGDRSWSYVYRKVQGYPAHVVVGQAQAAVAARWEWKMAEHLAIGVPTALVLCAITWIALQRARREEAALAQMRAEMRLREMAEAALHQSHRLEALGQLTGGVAHDFNNLLTIIMGNFEMILRAPERAERVAKLGQAGFAAAQRGAEVTAKLLGFSRRRMVRPVVADVNRLLTDFAAVLRQGATEAISLELRLDPILHAASLDPGQLEAAVLNLVANARDAMPSGGTVTVRTGNLRLSCRDVAELPDLSAGDYVRVAVSDNGSGMEPAVAKRAFEPFFTTKGVGRGTGLGLSQVYGFCKQAGGSARIISHKGAGTTVELLLPAVIQPLPPRGPVAAPASRLAPPRPAGASETVLVVEDEDAVREIAVASLEDLGYATLTASNAAAALALIRSDQQIDILFSDVVMPGGTDGLQLSQQARKLRPDLKVLLTSGFTGQDSARTPPPDALLLAKPYQREELRSKLAALGDA